MPSPGKPLRPSPMDQRGAFLRLSFLSPHPGLARVSAHVGVLPGVGNDRPDLCDDAMDGLTEASSVREVLFSHHRAARRAPRGPLVFLLRRRIKTTPGCSAKSPIDPRAWRGLIAGPAPLLAEGGATRHRRDQPHLVTRLLSPQRQRQAPGHLVMQGKPQGATMSESD